MLTLEDILIASRTLYGEGRSETYRGKLAIAHVIFNRLRASHGQFRQDNTLSRTCLRAYQFSTWNENDPNFRKIQEVSVNDKLFRECMRAVLEAYDNPQKDPTHGCFWYATTHLLNKEWPKSWGVKKQPKFTIGSHQFFDDID